MSKSDRLLHIAYRCLAIAGQRKDSIQSVRHFCNRADRFFAKAGRQRRLEGGAK